MGHLNSLVNYLTRIKFLSYFMESSLGPEMHRAGKPAFPNIHGSVYREGEWNFFKVKKILGKRSMKVNEKLHLIRRMLDIWAEKRFLVLIPQRCPWRLARGHPGVSGFQRGRAVSSSQIITEERPTTLLTGSGPSSGSPPQNSLDPRSG